ncbi:MAG: LamG-like jellyroll fold domain-containing protein [Candidatus Latescibacterota bacterium]
MSLTGIRRNFFTLMLTLGIMYILPASILQAASHEPGLLFYLSGEKGFEADFAAGDGKPAYLKDITIIPDGAVGSALRCPDFTQLLVFEAPGNLYAEQGTLSFFFRARYPFGEAPFKIFQASYCDHTSFDMAWMRIDYTGRGFDAFVTDVNLARVRVSYNPPALPGPEKWTHFALTWDETAGIRFFVDGKPVARKDTAAVFDAGLAFLGTHGYMLNPLSVSSGGSDIRSGDFDEFRVYDRMLAPEQVSRLAQGKPAKGLVPLTRSLASKNTRDAWMLRYGWNRPNDLPPALDASATTVRKVEVHDAHDLKQWLWKGCDGIRETTWPGVYNRSRIPGRLDYFILPDWNCYSLSGKAVTFTLPNEPWNYLEITGAAFGKAALLPESAATPVGRDTPLFTRSGDQERTFHRLSRAHTGGKVRFTNEVQETPIGEFMAYHVAPGEEPSGKKVLSFTVTGNDAPELPCLAPLREYIAGRHLSDCRAITAALSDGAALDGGKASPESALPLVHLLIPCEYTDVSGRTFTWNDLSGGLDGIALDLPALPVKPTHGGYFPLNIQVRDPLWPNRCLLDFSCSVKPGGKHTLWLDTRDRILPEGRSLYLAIAGAGDDFGPVALRGMKIRLVFKDREKAIPEHEIDRFTQARDSYGHIIESRPRDHKLASYDRFYKEVHDLLKVSPNHIPGVYYAAHGVPDVKWPEFEQPKPPAGAPLWAFRQIEYLKLIGNVILWWTDNRQIENGEFGGGLSDDSDMTHSWPIPALMGMEPEKITDSLHRELDAIYENGMLTDGLNTALLDALHTTEEGTNVQAQLMHLEYGDPELVERIMETSRGFERITGINAAGHRHFRSAYFSATQVVDEDPWLWTVEQTFRLIHPALSLVEFNGHPRAEKLLLEMADGLLAHRKQDAKGRWRTPGTIHFRTDEDKPSSFGAADHLFWGAFCWTGEEKYFQPLLDDGPPSFGRLNANVIDLLDKRASWGKEISAGVTPEKGNDYARYVSWQMTGDKRFLEEIYAGQIQDHSRRMYFMTEGQFWTDRLDLNAVELQRTRLGGVARRSKSFIYPGYTVSWKFPKPGAWADVAILVPKATREEFRIIGYNLSGTPVKAIMTAWDIEPGRWEMVRGIDPEGDDIVNSGTTRKEIKLERTENVDIVFEPGVQTIVDFRLKKKGIPYRERPDLGISRKDVRVTGETIRVTIHSIGAVDAPAGVVSLTDRAGRVLATTPVPPLKAPLDYEPKTAEVTLRIPRGIKVSGCAVEIALKNGIKEITRLNNRISIDSLYR